MKVEWKCTTNAAGVQSVGLIMDGALKRPTLSVVSLASLLHPRPGHMLTLVKDQGRDFWMVLNVMDKN